MSLSVSTLPPLARESAKRLPGPLPVRCVVREQDGLHVKFREPANRATRQRHVVREKGVRERDLPLHTLQKVAERHGFARAFLQMAIEIARHHHERYDGTGYPDRLAGEAIPLAARIVAIGDVYDAARSRRNYKPALPHAAVEGMIKKSSGQFDPALQQVFVRCAPRFERIFRELSS